MEQINSISELRKKRLTDTVTLDVTVREVVKGLGLLRVVDGTEGEYPLSCWGTLLNGELKVGKEVCIWGEYHPNTSPYNELFLLKGYELHEYQTSIKFSELPQ